MFTDVTYDMFLKFWNLLLWLRSTAEGQSFLWPNIWLRLKVKIAPTVQHWLKEKQMISTESKNYFFVQISGRLLYPIMRVLSLDGLFFHSPQAIDCRYAFQI